MRLLMDGVPSELRIVARHPRLVVEIDGRRCDVAGTEPGDGDHALGAFPYTRAATTNGSIVRAAGRTVEVTLVDPRAGQASDDAQDVVKAPMPGAVVSLEKQVGESVAKGETILTIESMKLQTALAAPREGIVAELPRTVGSTFERDDVLARLEPLDGDA